MFFDLLMRSSSGQCRLCHFGHHSFKILRRMDLDMTMSNFKSKSIWQYAVIPLPFFTMTALCTKVSGQIELMFNGNFFNRCNLTTAKKNKKLTTTQFRFCERQLIGRGL